MHHQPINRERSLTCQSFYCPDLVSFPVLSQIKPQIPHLVVPFRQFLQVSALLPYSPQNPSTQWFPSKIQKEFIIPIKKLLFTLIITTSYPWSASFMVWTTTVSDHFRSPNCRSWLMEMSLVNAFAVVCLE